MTPTTDTPTLEQRWRAACRAARNAGVVLRPNCNDAQRDELTDENLGDAPRAWSKGDAYSRVRFSQGELVQPRFGPLRYVYFNHNHGAAPILVEAFRNEGFTVEWDGTMARSVQITLS